MNISATFNHLVINPPVQKNGQGQHFNRDRPNTDDSGQQTQARNSRLPSDFILRGELLDEADQQQGSRSRFNQQISPQNRAAIESYLSSKSVSIDDDPRGRLLDQFV